MKKIFGKYWLEETAVELLGSLLAAVSLYNFAVPAEFPMTGFSGIAMIVYRLTGLPIGLVTLLLNIPVALLCFRVIGRRFFCRSLFCMLAVSLFTDFVAPFFPLYEGDRLLAAVCTGVVGGVGYALIYLLNSSTGGSDFIVMALKSKNQHIPLGILMFVIESLVVLAGGIIFRDFEGVVYGLIINFINAKIADKLMYGMNAGKLALIVTDCGGRVADKINELCSRGTTIVDVRGGYTGDRRELVICACAVKEMLNVENAVKEADSNAFTVILDSNEVMGEGFRRIRVAEAENTV